MIAFVPFDPEIAGWLLGAVLLGAAIAAQRWLAPSARSLRTQRRLHGQLATATGLDDEEAEALWRLARAAKLAEPAVAFVRPSLLEAGGLPGLRGEVLASLRQKLFAR